MTPPFKRPEVIAYSTLLAESFSHLTKRALMGVPDISHALYHAPFVLVSHGTQPDPIFCYANLTAQKLWGLTWDEFTQMPSRLAAEPVAQEERQRLLDEASRKGYVDNVEGVRITKEGRHFRIQDTLLWNVMDGSGVKYGQAAVINRWELMGTFAKQ